MNFNFEINPYAAELFVSIFHSFEAGIANANFQLQMTKNISISEKLFQ